MRKNEDFRRNINFIKKILGIKSPSKGDHILQNKKEDKK